MAKNNYVDNKRLYAEMTTYITALKDAKARDLPPEQHPRVNNYIGGAIKLIAERTSTRPNFVGYSFREEMISDGVENCLMYIYNFNPEKSNSPFAYFTQIIWYAFIRRIQKEQKQQYIKHKLRINQSTDIDLSGAGFGDKRSTGDNNKMTHEDLAKATDLVEKFEKSNKMKKTPKPGVEKFIGDENVESELTPSSSPADSGAS